MHEARIIPCLLLRGERLVKTRQFADPDYVGDPVNVLSIFNSFEVDEIVLLDIGAAHSRSPADPELLARYAEECFIPLAYGGGLEQISDIERTFSIGYEKVVLNSVVADDPDLVRHAAKEYGSQAIVVSMDVRGAGADDWQVYTHGATRSTSVDPITWAIQVEELGAGEILVTSVDREGTMSGFDLPLIRAVASSVGIPVVGHGGAGKRKQLSEPIRESGASAVAAGSLFVYQGSHRGVLINYPTRQQVIRLVRGDEQDHG